ncbi:MAG: hypothetical protein JXN59_14940 [Anaerolineae bacterium]|nr:hypothetical protein [Anaerolineae bacterium]
MLTRILLTLLVLSMATGGSGMTQKQSAADLVNLDHLRFLTEIVTINDETMALVHIYSEYPEYVWVDAAGEGISAVDDVARAAIVYLWAYERQPDPALLEMARQCLNFVLYMQAEDGEFYNFVYDREGTINTHGNTSYKSLGWWAMRGLWALGEGVRVFNTVDPAYADVLAEAYQRTEAALGATLGSARPMTEIHGFDVPDWIPGGEPVVASVGVLGMAAYYQARPNPTTAEYITAIAEGIAAYRLGDHDTYPFGMHPPRTNAPGYWHTWGAHMPHALVEAGIALNRTDWIDSAATSANSFLLRQLAFERFRQIGVVPDRLGQIAYGTNMLVQTYMALYRATGDVQYARYGGLAASWYFGNNMADTQMYFPETGRVYDGINGPVSWRVNRNAGAESTIEGLMSMLVVTDIPEATDLLYVRPISGNTYRILQAEDGQRVVGTPAYYSLDWTGEGYVSAGRYIGISPDQRMRLQFDVEQADDYLLYVAHVRQPINSNAFTSLRTDSPPVIDGNSDDWPPDLPVLSSNTRQQFVRGAGAWQGPEVDSHHLRLLWDDTHLYIAASVKDPEHSQPHTLSTAWQGDTLWFYVTSEPDARALSAKFSFAYTPDGPQVWDWLHARFLEGAVMAFAPAEDGYHYEAAIPWAALKLDSPAAGNTIGLECGRGIGGSAFMDLTGRDPDIAANLLQIMLVEPDTQVDLSSVPQITLQVQLDDHPAFDLPETVSPDSAYFWLDRVTPDPVRLEAGEHTIRYRTVSSTDASNPGLSKLDAFYLQPAVARRAFLAPDGREITLTYDTLTGESTWAVTP